MGLDMYLYKVKKIDGATLKEIRNINAFFEYSEDKENGKVKNYTPEEWNGCNVTTIDNELMTKYMPEYTNRYWCWDTEKKYGHNSLFEEIGYWRKANAIHNWFVENVQNGVDDCGEYEVSKSDLKELLSLCKEVKDNSVLVDGEIKNGYIFKDGVETPIYEDGKYIEDPTIAMELLPCSSGFFFGSQEYDEWYLQDIEYTIDKIETILKETDFNNEIIIYSASW